MFQLKTKFVRQDLKNNYMQLIKDSSKVRRYRDGQKKKVRVTILTSH